MSWLALDTATDRVSVALGDGVSDALEEELAGARRHASALLPLVDRLLARAHLTLDTVGGLLLSDGPGSFTGLRVGASVAKALARARGLKVRTAASLMVRAGAHARPGEITLALADALRGEVYAAAYRFSADRVETLLPPSVWRPERLIAEGPRPDRIVGDGPPAALARLGEWAGTVVSGAEALPRAAFLLELRHRVDGTRPIASLDLWEPEYGRPAEAQARWELAHGRPLPDSARSAG
ncbi:MAG TPA: tRNA (adenosine(37)-N6)-threonylcarbamoyltransferase complex dimerization subunit type 1 TsaB [Gemmatimonadales bacterium]